jgi:hypothetical protein
VIEPPPNDEWQQKAVPTLEDVGDPAAGRLWQEGLQMSIEEAIEYGRRATAGQLRA